MRRAAKVDTNQSVIVAALRKCGASVQSLHRVGQGVPDLLVGGVTVTGRQFNCLFEIKSGPKDGLTPDEEAWHSAWRGQVDIVRGPEEAVNLFYRLRGGLA